MAIPIDRLAGQFLRGGREKERELWCLPVEALVLFHDQAL